MPSKIFMLCAMWFVGFLHHTKYAFWSARRNEGLLWVFTTKDRSQAVRAAKFLLAVAAFCPFLIFLAVDLKIVLAIFGALLFSSSTVLSFRNS
ncbi:MAG TPA: hypothetical protein VJT70_05045 [Sphingomicrobium sp.]|nr:hypothetical protein [Sphingomicrobium sp.]